MSKTNLSLTIGHFFGTQMNVYGDNGNLTCLKKRCEWRGIKVTIKEISFNQPVKPNEFDLYFFGGGQDQAQIQIAEDLIKNHQNKQFQQDIEKGVPMLCICGGYQLMGEYYQPFEGDKLPGVGVFPAYTIASQTRMIGNLVIRSTDSLIVGFENHSGQTFLDKGAKPFGQVVRGFGNNGEDKTEGCHYKNAIGCYMHGSLLPKNPTLSDWLIQKALTVKYGGELKLTPLDDDLEIQAHTSAIDKFA